MCLDIGMIDTYMGTKQITVYSYKMHLTNFIGGGGRILFDLRLTLPTLLVENIEVLLGGGYYSQFKLLVLFS